MAATIALQPCPRPDLNQSSAGQAPCNGGIRPWGRPGTWFKTPFSPTASGVRALELCFLSGAGQRRGGRLTAFDRLGDGVEVTGAHLALMFNGREPELCSGELFLLQFHERTHLTTCVAVRELEHTVVQSMEPGQRDELEPIAHGTQFALEACDGVVIEILLPVEG